MDTVTKDRDKFVGGSDFPIILGLSPYKTRWQLLLEKLGVIENDFQGNKYTEFGNDMEPKIREYINCSLNEDYKPTCKTFEYLGVRCNVDGLYNSRVLEIKTAGAVDQTNKVYMAQLLFYLHYLKCDFGYLVIYERPESFDTEFNNSNLFIDLLSVEELKEVLKKNIDVEAEVSKFWQDFETLKTYLNLGFELTEDMIMNNEIIDISNEVLELQNKLNGMKEVEKQIKAAKEKLYQAMSKNNVKTWQLPSGTKITKVDETIKKSKTLDESRLENELNIDLDEYTLIKESKVRGYIKIT